MLLETPGILLVLDWDRKAVVELLQEEPLAGVLSGLPRAPEPSVQLKYFKINVKH